MDLIFEWILANIVCKYLIPDYVMPQYLSDNFVKWLFVFSPIDKFYMPLSPIKLSSNFKCLILVNGKLNNLPKNTQPKSVISFYSTSNI